MNMTRFRELLRRDGWLYAAIALAWYWRCP